MVSQTMHKLFETMDVNRKSILMEIADERLKQIAKFGVQKHSMADWLTILGEEVGETNKAALEAKFANGNVLNYREELIQVAAVAVAMVECFDTQILGEMLGKLENK